jgi:hypothetical protein
MSIQSIIQSISRHKNCVVHPPSQSQILLEDGDLLPDDVKEFYTLCNGIDLFNESHCAVRIVAQQQFSLANPILVGEKCEYDISSHWYTIADIYDGNLLTIDLHPERLGRCYDSHWDTHALVGSSTVIALSFTALLTQLWNAQGADEWYWEKSSFQALGDAYDGIRFD